MYVFVCVYLLVSGKTVSETGKEENAGEHPSMYRLIPGSLAEPWGGGSGPDLG